AGTLPDLDVLIHFPGDPLMTLFFHRHFTHALIMIPILAALCLLPFWHWIKHNKKAYYICALAGVGTHALLDATTTYGTLLFWPFTNYRVAWDFMPIIDPIYTIPLMIGAVLAHRKQTPRPAQIAFALTTLYIAVGAHQHDRALKLQAEVAGERGHNIERSRVTPTLANILLWRSVYQHEGQFHADALLLRPWGENEVDQGESTPLLNEEEFLSQLTPYTLERYEIFRWFADGYLARLDHQPQWIGDMRYSLAPAQFRPIWGIQFSEDFSQITYESFRRAEELQRPDEKPRWDFLLEGYKRAFKLSQDP
ncbi:MAG: metal-dependent hydrolase, partial [Methylococcales bacterium]|nr:metal-dependent hydrolase [Methylococcales bacterium]